MENALVSLKSIANGKLSIIIEGNYNSLGSIPIHVVLWVTFRAKFKCESL
jgi:hypothetical protein